MAHSNTVYLDTVHSIYSVLSLSIFKYFPEGCPIWGRQGGLVDRKTKENVRVGKGWLEGQWGWGRKKRTCRGSRMTEAKGSIKGSWTEDAILKTKDCYKILSTHGDSEWTGELFKWEYEWVSWRALEHYLPAPSPVLLFATVQSLSSPTIEEETHFSIALHNISTC